MVQVEIVGLGDSVPHYIKLSTCQNYWLAVDTPCCAVWSVLTRLGLGDTATCSFFRNEGWSSLGATNSVTTNNVAVGEQVMDDNETIKRFD